MRASEAGGNSWAAWLASAPGRYVLGWEQAHLDAAVADVFGFHALQCGLPQLEALRANRMPNRMLARQAGPAEASLPRPGERADEPAGQAGNEADAAGGARIDAAARPGGASGAPGAAAASASRPVAVVHSLATVPPHDAPSPVRQVLVDGFEDLPFATASLDLVVLPHALEFAADPHQVLREADRVLRPEGRVIVTGFNPVSLWGARQAAMRSLLRPYLPAEGQMLSVPRLRDWMRLLSFEPDRGRFGCYVPPVRTEQWLARLQWVEKAGDRWWPICGALYLMSAVKRVRGMRLIGPAWKPVPKLAVAGRASAQRERANPS